MPYLMLVVAVWSSWMLIPTTMVVIGILLGIKALYEEWRFRRDEKEEEMAALRERLNLAATRQPLWKLEGGGKLRACPACAEKLGLTALKSDGGKRRYIWGCEICNVKRSF